MQGRQSRFPVDNAWKTTDSDNLPNLDYAVVVGARLQTAWDAVAAHIQLQRSNDKERADQRSAAVTGCPVIVGDLVLVLEQALSPPGRSSATFSLFSLCFTGSQRFQRKERVARFSKFQIKRARSGNDKEETARSENSDFRLTRRQTTTFSNAPLTCSCCPSTAAPR
ncbi:hypothetical protein L596_002649 [Steinernema carpocapsae]|uniref:Uncharacterized protein n=1 Tax=Steinernema carpocapsae TaxID=34508 RepID=A0A4U8UTW6_STECR|nr:hypothetical protein L596_002649 [Steinernema carpocapsae]